MKNKAFTLIELLVALTIFSIIAVSVYSVFNTGIISWKKIDDRLNEGQSILMAFRSLDHELRNSLSYGKTLFSATSNELNFYTVKTVDTNSVDFDSIFKVSYFTEKGFLKKKEVCLWQDNRPSNLILAKIENIKFSFLSKKGWQDSWQDKKVLPKAVKVEVLTKLNSYTKTILIPISAFNQCPIN